MIAKRITRVVAASAIALAPAGTLLAHSGADSGALSATLHAWLHAPPVGGLVLAAVALAGLILVRHKLASHR